MPPPFATWSIPEGAPLPLPAAVHLGADADNAPGLEVLEVGTHWLQELASRLRGSGEVLRSRPVDDLIETLGRVGSRFLEPGDPLRAQALEALPSTTGLSPEMAAAVLDGMAADWTPERLARTVKADFPDPRVLDGFVPGDRRSLRALGPGLCFQLVSGSVPGVGATALLRSLLVKAPTLVKPGRGDVVLPVLLARALREEDPEVGRALAVVYWPGGRQELEDVALQAADVVTAYGGDANVGTLRRRTPVTTRFLAYHHRVSVGVVGREGLADACVHRVVSGVAGAVAFFDQRGCVSPQIVFVEEGGSVEPWTFAERLAHALAEVETRLPAGHLDAQEASALHQARGTAEVMAASGTGVRVLHGDDATWTVIYDPAGTVELACVGRVVRVRPVKDVSQIPVRLHSLRGHLQTVAWAGLDERLAPLAEALARAGATRIAPFDAAPFPPAGWRHDGRGPLEELVRWVDLEG